MVESRLFSSMKACLSLNRLRRDVYKACNRISMSRWCSGYHVRLTLTGVTTREVPGSKPGRDIFLTFSFPIARRGVMFLRINLYRWLTIMDCRCVIVWHGLLCNSSSLGNIRIFHNTTFTVSISSALASSSDAEQTTTFIILYTSELFN